MTHNEAIKWHMPGWRIEQKYSPGVLIGNWDENRYKFQKLQLDHDSTHRIDFKHYGTRQPDVTVRRKAQLRNDGFGKEFLFYHHGNAYSNNMISWYDEQFNKRERDDTNRLPEFRHWDSHKLSWVPEKSDHPIQATKNCAPTNFGYLEQLKKDWQSQIADETHGDYNTTYSASYLQPRRGEMVGTRYATQKAHSTSLHKFNHVNKNLNLRGEPMLQRPEQLPDSETDCNLGFSAAPMSAKVA